MKLLYIILLGLLCNFIYATTESATLAINLVSFNNDTGDLFSRVTLKLPNSSVDSFGIVKNNYLLAEKYTIDNGLLAIKKIPLQPDLIIL